MLVNIIIMQIALVIFLTLVDMISVFWSIYCSITWFMLDFMVQQGNETMLQTIIESSGKGNEGSELFLLQQNVCESACEEYNCYSHCIKTFLKQLLGTWENSSPLKLYVLFSIVHVNKIVLLCLCFGSPFSHSKFQFSSISLSLLPFKISYLKKHFEFQKVDTSSFELILLEV